MAIIRIDDFAGLNLRQDAKKGPFAQVAENVDLDTNAIVPTWGIDATSRVLLGTTTPKLTIHNLYGSTFLSWTQDVQVALNPLADNSDRRVYYTGDGEPRETDYPRAVANASPYVLGIPVMPPISSLLSVASGGAGIAQSRAYIYTWVSPWGEEGPPSSPLTITANATGATVELDRIGTSTRARPSLAASQTFIGTPVPGFLQITPDPSFRSLGLQVGERIYLGRTTAGAPAVADKAYVISNGGGSMQIAANCWPFTSNPSIMRVLPVNDFPITSFTANNGDTRLKFTLTDLAGVRVGEQLTVSGTGTAADGKTGAVLAIQGQDTQSDQPTVTIAWDGTAGTATTGALKRVSRHNTGETKITNVVAGAGATAVLTVDDASEVRVNDVVLVIGIMGAYQANGARKVLAVDIANKKVTVESGAVGAYTSGGLLVLPIPYAFDIYTINSIAAAAGGPYPTAFTTNIAVDLDGMAPGDVIIGYDIGGAVEMNTVMVVSAVAPGQVTVSMASSHTAWTTGGKIAVVTRGAKKRIYRTAQGTTDAEYQLVAEIPGEQCHYSDKLNDAALSSTVLKTSDWIAPPVDLHHVIAHPHGFLMGLSGNLLCQSEARAPHAWPVRLQKPMPVQSALALGLTGQSAIAVTTEAPYSFTGVDPQSMSREKVVAGEPCTSAPSLASAAAAAPDVSPIQGVAYRGKRGIFMAGPTSAANMTEGLLPASFFNSSPRTIGAFWAGKYVWVDNSAATGYILDPRGGDHALTQFRVDFNVSALHVSPVDGQLWASYTDTSTAPANIYAAPLFKITATNVRFDWRSAYLYLPKPVTMQYLLADFDWDSMGSWMQDRESQLVTNMRARRTGVFNSVVFNQGEFNGGQRRLAYRPDTSLVTPAEKYLKVTVIANPDSSKDRATVFDDFVSNDTPVKVDDGIKADVWQVYLLGNVKVTALTLASTMDELRLV